jgi:hypothetical protein
VDIYLIYWQDEFADMPTESIGWVESESAAIAEVARLNAQNAAGHQHAGGYGYEAVPRCG